MRALLTIGAAVLAVGLGWAGLRAAPPPAGAPRPLTISWQQSAPVPEPTDGYAAGVIGGRLIMAGGTYWEGTPGDWRRKIYARTTLAFDPLTQVWERLPDAPVALAYAASAVVNDELFILGGMQDGQASREIYVLGKTSTGFAWRHFGQLPEPRVFANGITLGGAIYVVGGNREFEAFDAKGTCCASLTARNTVWRLDPAAPAARWEALPGYPGEPRWLHKAATDGRAIYLFGGVFSKAENIPVKKINEVLRLDPAGGWTRVTDLPETLQIAAPAGIFDQIVLVSGSADVMLFDPATARFTPLAGLPAKATVTQFVWIAPFLVGAGGERDPEGPRRRSEWTFVGRVEGLPPAPAGP